MQIHSEHYRDHWAYRAVLIPMQIGFFILLHELSYSLYSGLVTNITPDLSWGVFVQYALSFYIGTVVVFGLTSLLIKKLPVWLLVIEAFVICFVCLSQLNYRPYRSLLLLADALIGIFLPLLIMKTFFRMRHHFYR